MIDSAVRILSLANQLDFCTRHMRLEFLDGEQLSLSEPKGIHVLCYHEVSRGDFPSDAPGGALRVRLRSEKRSGRRGNLPGAANRSARCDAVLP
jgi:hypothetical protein